MKRDTFLIHGDDSVAPYDSVTPSIAQGTNWPAQSAEAFDELTLEPLHPRFYNRHGNTNHSQVAAILAGLEGAEGAFVAASGMGVTTTAILSLLRAGDHVLAQKSMYGGVTSMMTNLLPKFGVTATFIDQTDSEAFEAGLAPNTRLILLETPSNPLLAITDLAAITTIARRHGVLTMADNTFATPINQRPHELGVDLVMHSATKYLGGHSDLMAGVITGSSELIKSLWETSQIAGAVLSPFNAWLLLRGLRTLSLRVERHNSNALAVARALEAHEAVRHVHYPGLASHPGHATARRQMSGFGGMLSVELHGGQDAAETFIDNLSFAHRASSLGDVSSLVVRPAALWAKNLSAEELAAAGVPVGLVRFSVGIEDQGDLIADVTAAASAAVSR